jgi:glycosyltransferase involved in cell wall biosynthesis
VITVGMVIPYHNHRKYIGECLESVGTQTRIPDYVVVVDDASKRKHNEIAVDHCQRWGFYLINHKENRGPSAARNAGIRVLLEMDPPPDVFICLDADDLIAPGYVEMMVDTLDEHPAAWVAYPEIQMFGFEQRVIRTPREYRPEKLLVRPFIVSASAFRAQMWQEIYQYNSEGWDTKADRWGWEDYLFFMEGLLGVRRGDPGAAVHAGPDKFWFLYRRFNRPDRSDGNETRLWDYFGEKMREHYGVTLPPLGPGGIER